MFNLINSKRRKLEEHQDSSREYETIFEKERGLLIKCKVCDKNCDTKAQFDIHSKSSKHIRKAEKWKLLSTETTQLMPSCSSQQSSTSDSIISKFYCNTCQKNCNTEEQLNSHFSGQSHKKKSLKFECKDVNVAEIPLSQSSTDTTNHCNDAFALECNVSPLSSPVKDAIIPIAQTKKAYSKLMLSPEFDDLLEPERSLNFIRCKLCNMVMNTQEQYVMHCNGTKHQRKRKTWSVPETAVVMETEMETMQIGNNELKFCDTCQIRIHANNMTNHSQGKTHREKLIKKTHTNDVTDKCPTKTGLSTSCEHFDNLKLVPRKYQMEVYEKSLNKDCVVFLPTGTGKTLVASMIILKMLEVNPHHRVTFLVDKVLLVMQQHDFFKEQFKDICMDRFDGNGSTSCRQLRLVGLANSYVNTDYTTTVRDHDIVVATADLFRGLLSNHILFWDELGLLILDEAHHCVKDHPYNKLLREYQLYPEHVLIDKTDIHVQLQNGIVKVNEHELEIWKRRRCKIVGLTASPAGTSDKNDTYNLLLELLEALGGVDIVNVIDNKEELETFTSNSNIETRLVPYSDKESSLREVLKDTFFFMIGKFEELILVGKKLLVTKDMRSLTVGDVSDFKGQLQYLLQETLDTQKTTINHVCKVLEVIDNIDTYGYDMAWLRLKDLFENDNEKVWFINNTIRFIEEIEEIVNDDCQKHSTVIEAIIEETKNISGESRTILVLVKERDMARQITKILQKECIDQQLVRLVGHGTGSSKSQKENKGMSVSKQKKALNLIKGRNNQIIVATSVADEGIDLPDCDLVILINPPSSVQALVQIRGRARKKSSRLLMICREQESIAELKLLQEKERNLIESIERVLSRNKL